MKKISVLVVGVLTLLVFAGCCPMHKRQMAGKGACCVATPQAAMGQPAKEVVRNDVLYSCDCGAACQCNSVSTTAGNCTCGKAMKWGHILKVEGDEALLCTCDEGCKCQLNEADANKCACGKEVKRVSLKDTGIFFCNCGGSCRCNTVSDEAGPCKCGMALKQH